MMQLKDVFVRGLRLAFLKITQKKFINKLCIINRQIANDEIYNLLMNEKPCMISRFGTTELICINNYLCIKSTEPNFKKIWNFISDKTQTPWWFIDNFKYMSMYSGIFPSNKETAEKFSERYLNDIPEIDLLGSFQYQEKFMPLRSNVKYVHLETLYPFFVVNPWTKALRDKKVLVIHPFEKTIQTQYKNRILLFEHQDILPDYKLITFKAVQSIAGTEVPFNDWFTALKFMEEAISAIEFDICLIGCGAYGLPLAAHVKRMGKKAVHIGGGLQLLFGIKGKRWDDPNYLEGYDYPTPYNQPYNLLYNDKWIKPLLEDNIPDASKVDGACYW